MHGIPGALGRRAYLSLGREVGPLCVERLAVFVPSLLHPLLSSVYQCDGVPVLSREWGLMAGLSGFASHQCSLHLGAGCQKW